MKFVLITKDAELEVSAREGFHPSDECFVYSDWRAALDASDGANLIFVDLLATLEKEHKIAGYERFGLAKMSHPVAGPIPLVLIGPEPTYDLDFMVGWPDFVFGHLQRPVNYKLFRRASTWV